MRLRLCMSICIVCFVVNAQLLMANPGGEAARLPETTYTEQTLPLSRIALFSSGVAWMEYAGKIKGAALVKMDFRSQDVADVLKSFVVRDTQASATLSYRMQEDIDRTLAAFEVDLSGSPDNAELLERLRGCEIEAGSGTRLYIGRILRVEQRPVAESERLHDFLLIRTASGVNSIALDELDFWRFTDAAMEREFVRALERLDELRKTDSTVFELRLDGASERAVSVSCVLEAPVWKTSYRLDLSDAKPWLQGWAIVDNASAQDWNAVELSLISGRPVSFVQDLYAPYWVDRPVVPLAIAGSAMPRSYEGGVAESVYDEAYEEYERVAPQMMYESGAAYSKSVAAPQAAPAPARLSDAAFTGARTRSAGDQFEFTIPHRVTVERGRSAMLPLLATAVEAEAVSVFSRGSSLVYLGAILKNTSGMKLPAGPITVFDGSVYAGDALLDFLPEGDRQILSYGEDLALRIVEKFSSTESMETVRISKGVLIFTKRQNRSVTYTMQSAHQKERILLLEHPRTASAQLTVPSSYYEMTDAVYRFKVPVKKQSSTDFTVTEQVPLRETVQLLNHSADTYLRYSSSYGISAAVKAALEKAAKLRAEVDTANKAVSDIQTRRTELISGQQRMRDNLQAIGRESSEGRSYLSRLLAAEDEIVRLEDELKAARMRASRAKAELDAYIQALDV